MWHMNCWPKGEEEDDDLEALHNKYIGPSCSGKDGLLHCNIGFPWIIVVIVVYRWITAAGSDRGCRHVVVIVVLVSGFVVALWTTAMHVEFTVKYKSNICIPDYMSETTIKKKIFRSTWDGKFSFESWIYEGGKVKQGKGTKVESSRRFPAHFERMIHVQKKN